MFYVTAGETPLHSVKISFKTGLHQNSLKVCKTKCKYGIAQSLYRPFVASQDELYFALFLNPDVWTIFESSGTETLMSMYLMILKSLF